MSVHAYLVTLKVDAFGKTLPADDVPTLVVVEADVQGGVEEPDAPPSALVLTNSRPRLSTATLRMMLGVTVVSAP